MVLGDCVFLFAKQLRVHSGKGGTVLYVFGNELEAQWFLVTVSAYSQNNFREGRYAVMLLMTVSAYSQNNFWEERYAVMLLVTVSACSQNNFREERYAVMLLVTVLCLPIRKTASKAPRASSTAVWAWTALIPKGPCN